MRKEKAQIEKRKEKKSSNEWDDLEKPKVYRSETEITGDDNDDDGNEGSNWQTFIEHDSSSMASALDLTGKCGFLSVDDEVYSLIQSENPYVQWAATQVLGKVADDKSFNLLAKALNSPSFDVRWGAATAIAEIANKWLMRHLAAYLVNQDAKYLDRIEKAFQELWNK